MEVQNINYPTTGQHLQSDKNEDHTSSASRRRRNQQPVRICADDEDKSMLYLYVITILLPLLVALLIVVLAIPHAMDNIHNTDTLAGTSLQGCTGYLYKSTSDPSYLSCFTSFQPNKVNSPGMYIRSVSNLNQFLTFYLDLAPYADRQNSTVSTFGEDLGFLLWQAQYETKTNKIRADKLLFNGTLQGVRSISTLKKDRVFLAVESKLTSQDQFFWSVNFQVNSTVRSTDDFYLNTETVKSSFTIYTILLRVFFFLISLGVFIRYTSLLVQIPKYKISMEQRYIHGLSALTLLFNDQLYFITVLWPNPVTSFLSAIFLWNFFFDLFAIWACFLLRIFFQEPDHLTVETKNCKRVFPFVVFYLCGFAFCAAFAIIQSDEHPILSPNSVDNGFFKFLLVMTIIGFILAVLYIVYLFFSVQLQKPLIPYRNQVFIYFSAIFFVATVIVVSLGSLDVFNYSSGLIMFSFAFNNLYSYLLQYLYSPTKEQLRKFKQHSPEDLPVGQLYFQEEIVDVQSVDIDLTLLEDRSEPSAINEKIEKKLDLDSSSGSVRQRMRKNRRNERPEERYQKSVGDISGTKEKIVRHQQQEQSEQFEGQVGMDLKDLK